MSTQRGTSTVQANGVRIRYTDAGNHIQYDYEGTQAAVAALVPTLRNLGYEVEYLYNKSPLATITATYPDSEAPGRTGDITDTDNSSGLFTAPAHELSDGDAVTISGIVGIIGTATFFIRYDSDDTFYLFATYAQAMGSGSTGKQLPTNNDDTGSFTKQESPQPRWELFSEVREVPVDQAIYISTLGMYQLDSSQRKIIGKAARGEAVTVAEAATFTGAQATLLDAVIRDGLRTIAYDVPVVTVSKTVTSRYDNSAAMTNVGAILTTAELTSLEAMEDGLLDGLAEFTALPNTIVGWRKSFPRREALGGGRFAIATRFEYDWWNNSVFEGV